MVARFSFREYMLMQRKEMYFYKNLIENIFQMEVDNNNIYKHWISLFANDFNKEFWTEIDKHKWYVSEKKGYDIGIENAVEDWASQHKLDFIERWHQGHYSHLLCILEDSNPPNLCP